MKTSDAPWAAVNPSRLTQRQRSSNITQELGRTVVAASSQLTISCNASINQFNDAIATRCQTRVVGHDQEGGGPVMVELAHQAEHLVG